MKGYLKTVEVAKRFEVDPRTVLRWVRMGFFPGAIKKNPHGKNSPIYIPIKSVEKFAEAQVIQPEERHNGN